ncbi:MAG: ChaN family lipoprotein [Sneathiella sp.]|nr:ChaN family lipoprotein [Sneathiella sp.]
MTRVSRLSGLFLAVALSACAAPDERLGLNAPLPSAVAKSEVASRVSDSDFILLGEKHDNLAHHQVQSAILRHSITAKDGVVFEMITKDQQPVIDQYLGGDIPFAELEAALNWKKSGWPDWSFYAPLFKTAKEAQARILYGSYPRKELMGKMKAQNSDFQTLPEGQMANLNKEIKQSHCDLLPENMISPMSNMQIAKDHLMAAQMLKVKEDGKAFLIAGNGHVRKDRGVPYYLKQRLINQQILVVGIIEVTALNSEQDQFSLYDTIWTTDATPEKDYCAGLRAKFGKK